MVEYPANSVEGIYSNIPYDFEILEIFFKNKNVIVNWIYCNYTWGWFDDETGRWTGAVGKVKLNTFLLKHNSLIQIESDEADLAVQGFACTYGRSKVALCPPAVCMLHFISSQDVLWKQQVDGI